MVPYSHTKLIVPIPLARLYYIAMVSIGVKNYDMFLVFNQLHQIKI